MWCCVNRARLSFAVFEMWRGHSDRSSLRLTRWSLDNRHELPLTHSPVIDRLMCVSSICTSKACYLTSHNQLRRAYNVGYRPTGRSSFWIRSLSDVVHWGVNRPAFIVHKETRHLNVMRIIGDEQWFDDDFWDMVMSLYEYRRLWRPSRLVSLFTL